MNGIQLCKEHFLVLCLNVYEQDQKSFADFDLIRVLVKDSFGVVSLRLSSCQRQRQNSSMILSSHLQKSSLPVSTAGVSKCHILGNGGSGC